MHATGPHHTVANIPSIRPQWVSDRGAKNPKRGSSPTPVYAHHERSSTLYMVYGKPLTRVRGCTRCCLLQATMQPSCIQMAGATTNKEKGMKWWCQRLCRGH